MNCIKLNNVHENLIIFISLGKIQENYCSFIAMDFTVDPEIHPQIFPQELHTVRCPNPQRLPTVFDIHRN